MAPAAQTCSHIGIMNPVFHRICFQMKDCIRVKHFMPFWALLLTTSKLLMCRGKNPLFHYPHFWKDFLVTSSPIKRWAASFSSIYKWMPFQRSFEATFSFEKGKDALFQFLSLSCFGHLLVLSTSPLDVLRYRNERIDNKVGEWNVDGESFGAPFHNVD